MTPLASLEPEDDLDADFVIVGSGAAGATAAWTLAEAGRSVLVVEEGRVWAPEEFGTDVAPALSQLYRQTGAIPAVGRTVIPILQARAVGGTTVTNAAIAWEPPGAILRSWSRDAGLADSLAEDRVGTAWEEVRTAVGVREVPPELLGGNGERMARGAAALGITGRIIRRFEDGCRGSGRCIQGCPNGAKRSMDRTLLPLAAARGARLLASARVVQIRRQRRGIDVVVVTSRGRRILRARVGAVLAASATGTAPLLRRSGLRHPGLGRGFMAHPGLGLMGRFDGPVDMHRGATQSWESAHFWADRFKLESLGLPPALAMVRLPGYGPELARRAGTIDQMATWAVQVRARAEGRVGAGLLGPWVRYDVGDDDLEVASKGVRCLVRMMFAAGAIEVYPGIHGVPEAIRSPDELPERAIRHPRQAHFIATHLFGGARMGPDPGVHPVDLDFAVRGWPGLWVVDSSVFPSNLGVNPQGTMMAVARVGALRIAERAGGRAPW